MIQRRDVQLADLLIGVMRFLQLEWHNHERARNAWDIERAEMKAKIAKQEGDIRSARKLNDQLDKHVRMLELALKNERAKKGATKPEDTASGGEEKKTAPKEKAPSKPSKRRFRLLQVLPHHD